MSQWDKMIQDILNLNKSLRFEDLSKALLKMGYKRHQQKGGSSHYTFRKRGSKLITLPKSKSMNKVYIELVRDAVIEYESEVE